jgi:hypothetical protein
VGELVGISGELLERFGPAGFRTSEGDAEDIHVLGAVEPCAPHYGRNGHVVDDPADLM